MATGAMGAGDSIDEQDYNALIALSEAIKTHGGIGEAALYHGYTGSTKRVNEAWLHLRNAVLNVSTLLDEEGERFGVAW